MTRKTLWGGGGGWDKSLPVKVGYAGNEGGLE